MDFLKITDPSNIIGEGRNRIVYSLNDRFVIKIAKNSYGECNNYKEHKIFANNGKFGWDFPIAWCKLYRSNSLYLIMEKLKPANYDNLPGWVSYVDCCQVGIDFKGNLVAYDYAE
jgi:hypothetical protein